VRKEGDVGSVEGDDWVGAVGAWKGRKVGLTEGDKKLREEDGAAGDLEYREHLGRCMQVPLV
jgi:hypothetical protein